MSWSSLSFRAALMALSLTATAGLAGCTGLTPVYGDNGAAQALKLSFAQPTNPLEQIVYQDLQRRFGTTDDPNAPQVSVQVTAAARDLAQSTTTDPATSELATATGNLKIKREGQIIANVSRQATATFTQDAQGIADYTALNAAEEQAAHALADTLELTIMSTLMPSAPAQ
jgi:LPS-assembly lipoprotein